MTTDSEAFRAGYAQAVAQLRDDDRYSNWWSADGAWQHKPTGRYWDGVARGHLAEYLETIGPSIPIPRTWAIPDEPGPEVTAVRDCRGVTWTRDDRDFWISDSGYTGPDHRYWRWHQVLGFAPLTDVTPVARVGER
jgi:hypothetical protein